MEDCALDPRTGQPLAGSLMDYAMPRADTLPSFRAEIAEVLSPTNPLGIKAGGEGGTTPALAVMASAILDALRPLGVREVPMPASPHALWQAIHDAKAR
jgi:carbon-monoxide dehydrogenase large subunit